MPPPHPAPRKGLCDINEDPPNEDAFVVTPAAVVQLDCSGDEVRLLFNDVSDDLEQEWSDTNQEEDIIIPTNNESPGCRIDRGHVDSGKYLCS